MLSYSDFGTRHQEDESGCDNIAALDPWQVTETKGKGANRKINLHIGRESSSAWYSANLIILSAQCRAVVAMYE